MTAQTRTPTPQEPADSPTGTQARPSVTIRKLHITLMIIIVLIPLWDFFLKELTPENGPPLYTLLRHTATHLLSLSGAIVLFELICIHFNTPDKFHPLPIGRKPKPPKEDGNSPENPQPEGEDQLDH